ncbi:MAG: zinc ABC transporter solute-binding protein [Methylococcales bacterium]|nr:zinc ABC transporter solute-binding protein [Methylococcales bacterium]MBT7410327.1 zinc ABC transporter solute-binding protein [Methylococcales bacterium]
MLHQMIKIVGFSVLLQLLCSNTVYAQIKVFACEPEWAALARALGGHAVKVHSATTAQQDPHHIQARPSLIAKVRRADLLVCTGAELEVGWLPLLLRKSGNAKIQPNSPGYFMTADHITLLEKPVVLDRSLGDIHAAGNPHFHFDPHRMLQIAHALTARLTKINAKNSGLYQQKLLQFSEQWQQAILKWKKRTQVLRGKRIVVSHNSWVYLSQWLGLVKVATLEPKPGIPPSSRHLSKVLGQLKQKPADMILYADYQNNKSARWLSQRTEIISIGLPYSVADEESLIHWFDRLLDRLLPVES